jgi:hypothetical protein
MGINLKVNRRIDMETIKVYDTKYGEERIQMEYGLNTILQAKKYELEYCIVQRSALDEDILSLKGEIYEIEQIQSSNT